MPETGRPFQPPGPWFNNQEGLPPPETNVSVELDVGFIPSVTQVYPPSFPDVNVPFVPSVTTVFAPSVLNTGQQGFEQTTFSASGSWLCPDGVTSVQVATWGAGGGALAWGHHEYSRSAA